MTFEMADEQDYPAPLYDYTFVRPESLYLSEYTNAQLEDMEYDEFCECGGRLFVTGGNGYYNGSYQCYTQYAICSLCGPTEWECV